MRRVIAALVLAFVAVAHATDPLICPDGCTNDNAQSHSATTPGREVASTCLLCQNGVTVGPDAVAPTTVRVELVIVVPPKTAIPFAPDRPIEHPPRFS